MGTQVALFGGSTLPAFAQNRELSETAKALAGSGAGSDRISIKGGVFRLVVGGKEVAQIEARYMDVVIVKAASSPRNSGREAPHPTSNRIRARFELRTQLQHCNSTRRRRP